jgi:hypothetical protein
MKNHFTYVLHVIRAHMFGFKPLTASQYDALCDKLEAKA